jgi:hypothetical protein
MNVFNALKRGMGAGVVALACAYSLAGCSAGDDANPTTEVSTVAEETTYNLPAGEAGIALGVANWRLDASGVVEALDPGQSLLGRYQILEERQGIVSLSAGGELRYDSTGAIIADTLSALDKSLTGALREDLIAASEAVSQEAASGGQEALEWVAFACCNAGTAAILYQWWSGGWTPYCSFQQQSGSCSGLWECGPLAANRGCQFWL